MIQNLNVADESADYEAAEFTIDTRLIKFRAAKITPTKIGQFVTFWNRIGKGPIQPYSIYDPFDLLIVSAHAGKHFGQFIFPKRVLCEKGIVSTSEKKGKRAIRIYPPWDKTENPQARKTQGWQLEWFLDIPENFAIDLARFGYLLT
ncbi:MAG: MepB family protein [Candidatus Protochlamydia sp.]|nr:MepB family protein [Candidatus Protochlamydia sp.]